MATSPLHPHGHQISTTSADATVTPPHTSAQMKISSAPSAILRRDAANVWGSELPALSSQAAPSLLNDPTSNQVPLSGNALQNSFSTTRKEKIITFVN